ARLAGRAAHRVARTRDRAARLRGGRGGARGVPRARCARGGGLRADASRALAPRSLCGGAPAPARQGDHADLGGNVLHLVRAGRVLFLPERQGHRAHGRSSLAGVEVQSPPRMSTLGWIVLASVAGGAVSVAAAALALLVRTAWIPTLVSFAIGALLGAAFLEV